MPPRDARAISPELLRFRALAGREQRSFSAQVAVLLATRLDVVERD